MKKLGMNPSDKEFVLMLEWQRALSRERVESRIRELEAQQISEAQERWCRVLATQPSDQLTAGPAYLEEPRSE